jgi:protoporphyrinogen oxidase
VEEAAVTRPSRRDVLAALLGTPALASLSAAGCARRSVPPGEIVGGDVTLGHELRDHPAVESQALERVPIVIVGAGVAGLSAAWRLSASPEHRFVLLELEREPGGTSRSCSNDVTPFPWGAHYVPSPSRANRALVRLLREMGVVTGIDADGEPIVGEEHLVVEPEERVFYRGEWHEGLVPETALDARAAAQMRAFRDAIRHWAAWRDGRGRRAFSLPMALGSDDAEVTALDAFSAAEWLDRAGLDSPCLRWYVDYACRDDYGCRLDTTSAWAALFYFASRMRAPDAPTAPLLSWPEGNGRIVRHLGRGLGDKLRTGQLAYDVVPRDDGVEVIAIDARSRRATTLVADQVILAVPRFVAGRLLRPWRAVPPADLLEIETAPWLVANLHLRERPRGRGFVPAWDNVLYDSPSLGYVDATHQRGRRFGPGVYTYYYALTDADPRRARNKLLSATREEWVEVILADLGRALPDLGECVERIDLYRWGHAMVRPRPGFVWSAARRRAARRVFERVHFACTDLSGIALFEEAHYHGVRAAEDVLRGRGEPVEPWI